MPKTGFLGIHLLSFSSDTYRCRSEERIAPTSTKGNASSNIPRKLVRKAWIYSVLICFVKGGITTVRQAMAKETGTRMGNREEEVILFIGISFTEQLLIIKSITAYGGSEQKREQRYKDLFDKV
ncbi:hypothetical protein D1872_282220 [compost metagenome]